jgi:superfamily I DNA/RNA helicase
VDHSATVTTPKVLTVEDALAGDWIALLPDSPLEREIIKRLVAGLSPRLTVEVPQRSALADEAAEERARQRIVLDLEQSTLARQNVDDVLAITGPPGSGKTLVLAARACWLAQQHPDWNIQILCFNRLLVPYLAALVEDHDGISVNTFGKFAYGLGFRISLDDEDKAAREVAQALPKVHPVVDALLIDEWQDFAPAWTQFAMATVRSGRGAIVLAGDPLQALYRDSGLPSELRNRTVQHAALTRPYRSTRQVLEVASALDPLMEIAARDKALEGEPVDLVWAENPKEQAAAVVRDIQMLLESGERRPQDIGVLVTRKWRIGQVMGRLKDAGIPCRAAYPKYADQLSVSEPTVKIMTVHSAKGYEFDVLFLIGLEDLPNPDGTPKGERQGRCGYVGATRARDQLVLTYTKDNVYLERIRAIPEDTLRRWVWPDDYPEA